MTFSNSKKKKKYESLFLNKTNLLERKEENEYNDLCLHDVVSIEK